jgi:hypothetical protein
VDSFYLSRSSLRHYQNGSQISGCKFTSTTQINLIVAAPAAAGLAVPGFYMLFVVSEEGVPSVAKLVHLDVPE